MTGVLRVTIEDLEDGTKETVEIPAGEYFLICTAPCHEDSVMVYKGGRTHVITVKDRTP